MEFIRKLINDTTLVFTLRILLVLLMVAATLRLVFWMYGAELNIQVNLDI